MAEKVGVDPGQLRRVAVASSIGDRVGRKAMLVASLVLMGAATVGVGLLPTYAQIGVLAPILLVVMRLLQGVSAGGEWGGAALMAVEHAPPGKRGAYGSFSQVGVPAGLILAQLLFITVTAATTPEQFAAWGWRLPFLFSIVLVVVGLVVRLSLAESPVFAALQSEQARSSRPNDAVVRVRLRDLPRRRRGRARLRDAERPRRAAAREHDRGRADA